MYVLYMHIHIVCTHIYVIHIYLISFKVTVISRKGKDPYSRSAYA